jgi:aryl-alcohol dehydrogenase-like predicted oxidoreductase
MRHERRWTRRRLIRNGAVAAAAAGFGRAGSGAPGEYRRGGMIYRPLGRTGISVSLLAFGSHTDPAYKRKAAFGHVLTEEGQARRDRLLERAFELGVNLVDVYENEGQWEPLARLVKSRRHQVLISTVNNHPEFIGKNVDRAARLFGHVDLFRTVCLVDQPDGRLLENWDVLRKAKEAGKVRAIGVASHTERQMMVALRELDGLDYLFFPYNFIHAGADYSEFLPAAVERGLGLVAIKPLAAGSIANLDPRARRPARPENPNFELYQSANRGILPAVVAELTKNLDRMGDETLCQAALRYVYSRPYLSCAIPGMFDQAYLEDNFAALGRYHELSREAAAALEAARTLARALGRRWLQPAYSWLEEEWYGHL